MMYFRLFVGAITALLLQSRITQQKYLHEVEISITP